VAKKYIIFHYNFSHGGQWLLSIPDLTIFFSHGVLWLKSISDFTIQNSHGGLWFQFHYTFIHGVLWLNVYQISQYFLATALCG
jgi:hypothetical protein